MFQTGGVSRSGLVLPFLSFFGLFWPFGTFPGIFPICSGMVRGFSRFVLFLFLGLLRAPTRNSPERVRDTIWTCPEKSGKHPGLETPRFSFSQLRAQHTEMWAWRQKGPEKLPELCHEHCHGIFHCHTFCVPKFKRCVLKRRVQCSSEHVFLNNFRWVPDSCRKEEGKSLRELFEKVGVIAVLFWYFGISGWSEKSPALIKIKSALPPPNPKYNPPPHPPKRGILWTWRFPAERTQKFYASIKLAQPFPAPELRTC